MTGDGKKRGWINKAGQWIITEARGKGYSVDFTKYSYSQELAGASYSEGLAPFVTHDSDRVLRGYMNQRGEVVIEPRG